MKRFSSNILIILLCITFVCASALAEAVPYTMKLAASVDIYQGAGYEYDCTRQVGEDGVYTIVEEAYDEYGNLWGRLKSGVGWVVLAEAPAEVTFVALDESYTVALGAWVPIYDYPCEMDGVNVGIVGEDGVYTIVSEALDGLGNYWGELKSGAGWVNLTYVRTMGDPYITAYFADVVPQIDAYRCDCVLDDSEYMVRIAFRANKKLNDVRFTTLEYGDIYEVVETHYWFPWLEEDTYFVAGVVFYGDMTTYGISFVDEYGEQRNYAVSLSGMNGALVLNEYVQ